MLRDPITSYGDDLAVLTVTRAGTDPAAVARLVRSARAASTRAPRIVVAHSGTGRGSVLDGAADVEVLALGEDVGRAAAVNRAVAGLDHEVGWVALADPGVVWPDGGLDALLGAARPRAAAIGPLLRDPSGAPVPSGGDLPTRVDALRGRTRPGPPRAGVVGWVPATCVLLRRAALDSVDGFDPRYPGGFDDVDLGDRLMRAGWLSLHVPAVEVTVHPLDGQGMLEPLAVARRRYVHDRSPAVARALLVLAGRGRGS